MSTQQPTIIYTLTDEAPLLATSAFLPIIRTFTAPAGIRVESSDISVAAHPGRVPDHLTEEQRVPDTLAELGKLTLKPEANIIKLPNISASVGAAGGRHQGTAGQGLQDPDYPETPRPTKRRPSARATPSASAAR
jgi:isocitrate dehydrogenase